MTAPSTFAASIVRAAEQIDFRPAQLAETCALILSGLCQAGGPKLRELLLGETQIELATFTFPKSSPARALAHSHDALLAWLPGDRERIEFMGLAVACLAIRIAGPRHSSEPELIPQAAQGIFDQILVEARKELPEMLEVAESAPAFARRPQR